MKTVIVVVLTIVVYIGAYFVEKAWMEWADRNGKKEDE
jgi:hypothetical protein